MKIYVLSSALFLLNCVNHGKDLEPYQLPGVVKYGVKDNKSAETTPIVKNGNLEYISHKSNSIMYVSGDYISNPDGDISAHTFVSAYTELGDVWIYGTRPVHESAGVVDVYKNGVFMGMALSTDETDQDIYNHSVSRTDNGYVMAYEVVRNGVFVPRFAFSNDLIHWQKTPLYFSTVIYSACPTIRYNKGNYYLFYLVSYNDKYYTAVSKSTNLLEWETSQYAVVLPDSADGINSSDFDMVEYNGRTEIVYLSGDQRTWMALSKAYYDGSNAEFYDALFK